jgi:hypothetical protein
MNESILRDLFESLPEVQVLLQCARRLGVGIGLRGGVVRNMLFTEGASTGRYDSLYDFVDPFGDIDLVITDDTKHSVFVRSLFADVPFADCHVWDLQTVESGEVAAKREASVAADALTVWFDGREDHKTAVRLIATELDVERILEEPTSPIRPFNLASELSPAAIARLIKFARIQLQKESSAKELFKPLAFFADRFHRLVREQKRPLSRRSTFQAEIELAEMFMTAPDWRQASALQRQLSEILMGDWLRENSPLRQMLTVRPAVDGRIGAALYKPSAKDLLKVEFTTAEAEEEGKRTRIPWTRLQLKNNNEGTCCPYSDFEEGIAVVAWRNTEGEATKRDQRLSEEEYGLVAYPIAPTQSMKEVLGRNRRIPMLGYVRKGRSIVTRLDSAYLKMITGGRFSTFVVGLVSVLAEGGIESPETNPPVALAPEGEAASEPIKEKRQPTIEERWKKRRKVLLDDLVLK